MSRFAARMFIRGAAIGASFVLGTAGWVTTDAGSAEPQRSPAELVEALRAGGLVILMRHTSTDDYVPGDGTHVEGNCATQRNLDERGKAEARAVGEAIKTLGIEVGPVWSSPYCRCVQTGKLAFGEVIERDELAVFDELSGEEKDARGRLIRDMLNTQPPEGRNKVIITHTGSLLYSFGLQTRPEGVAHVFRPSVVGPAIYLGRVSPKEWMHLAGIAASDS